MTPRLRFPTVARIALARSAALAAFVSCVAGPSFAADGGPLVDAPKNQRSVSVSVPGAIGPYLVWRDERRSDKQILSDIYATLLPPLVPLRTDPGANLVSGFVEWPENGVPACESGTAENPFAMPDGEGGVLILWSDNRIPRGIYMQRLMSDGTRAPGFPADGRLVTSDVFNALHAACSDGNGGAYFIRTRVPGGPGIVHATIVRIDNEGVPAPGWTMDGVSVAGDEVIEHVGITSDPTDDAAVYQVRTYFNGQISDFRSQRAGRIDASGVVTLAKTLPGWRSSFPGVIEATVVPDYTGGIFAAWNDGLAPTYYGQHWSAAGTALWPDSLPVPAIDEIVPEGSSGRAYFAGAAKGGPVRLLLTLLGTNGTTDPAWDAGGNILAQPNVLGPVLARRGPIGVTVIWSDHRGTASGYDLRLTAYRPNGQLELGYHVGGEVLSDAPGNQLGAFDAGFLIGWTDDRAPANGLDLWLTDFTGPIGEVDVPPIGSPGRLAFRAIAPNPATSRGPVAVRFTLAPEGPGRLELVDVRGRSVHRQDLDAGASRASVETRGLAAGLYFLRLTQGAASASARLVVVE